MDQSHTGGWRITVATGGTFTDVVVADNTGRFVIGQALTTPDRIYVGLKAAFVARPFERGPGRTIDTSPEPDFDYWASDFEDLAEQLGA